MRDSDKIPNGEERGLFARSLAGHDKGTIYIVVSSDERTVMVADGKRRPAAYPKKKNRKHLDIDPERKGSLSDAFREGGTVRDEEIRTVIRRKKADRSA